MASPSLFIGLISGTSMDGVDAVLVDFSDGCRLLATHSQPYPEPLATRLLSVAGGASTTAGELARLDGSIALSFAAAADRLLQRAQISPGQVAAIGSHGQNVYHGPGDDPPVTFQLGDPNIIAHETGITTAADFRRRDLASGGQGAPLAPALHQRLFRHADEERAVVNLGGIANLTLLAADPALPLTGFDTGPANCLMDAWCRRHLGQPYDAGGQWAASAEPVPKLLETWLSDPYFDRPGPKSTGIELFNLDWAERGANLDQHSAAAVQSSLAELTAITVSRALRASQAATDRLLTCGGGVHNRHLVSRIAHHLRGVQIQSTDSFGLDPDWVEAVLFAWLARELVQGRSLDLVTVTGGSAPHPFGGIYPA